MKFKTFISLVGCGVLLVTAVIAGPCIYIVTRRSSPPVVKQPVETPPITATPTNPDPTTPNSTTGGRAVDQDILNYLRQPANGDKVKDAFPGKPYKVSFYQDTPGSGWNRAKIDLNRNGKWEEKITIENGQMTKRQVATNDNENYDVEYRWRGGQWVLKQK